MATQDRLKAVARMDRKAERLMLEAGWTDEDERWARSFGWELVVQTGLTNQIAIAHIGNDNPLGFEDDIDARWFVRGMAAGGDDTALKAIELHKQSLED